MVGGWLSETTRETTRDGLADLAPVRSRLGPPYAYAMLMPAIVAARGEGDPPQSEEYPMPLPKSSLAKYVK